MTKAQTKTTEVKKEIPRGESTSPITSEWRWKEKERKRWALTNKDKRRGRGYVVPTGIEDKGRRF